MSTKTPRVPSAFPSKGVLGKKPSPPSGEDSSLEDGPLRPEDWVSSLTRKTRLLSLHGSRVKQQTYILQPENEFSTGLCLFSIISSRVFSHSEGRGFDSGRQDSLLLILREYGNYRSLAPFNSCSLSLCSERNPARGSSKNMSGV